MQKFFLMLIFLKLDTIDFNYKSYPGPDKMASRVGGLAHLVYSLSSVRKLKIKIYLRNYNCQRGTIPASKFIFLSEVPKSWNIQNSLLFKAFLCKESKNENVLKVTTVSGRGLA